MKHATPIALCCGMFALAFALRCVQLGQESFWTDEGVALSALRIGITAHVCEIETSPPLYFMLNKIWVALFGASHLALRLAAVLPGALAVPAIYVCARRWGLSQAWGIALMLWVCIHPLLYFQSQQARYYALLLLLGIIWLATLPALLRAKPRQRDYAAFLISGFLGFSTHYYFAFYLIASGLGVVACWAVRSITRGLAWRLIALHVALAAACCLYLPLLLHQLSLKHTEYLPPATWQALGRVLSLINFVGADAHGWRWVAPCGIALLATGMLGLACTLLKRAKTAQENSLGRWVMILILALGPNVLAFAISRVWKPIFLPERYSTLFIPAFMIAAAMGWSAFRPAMQRAIAIVLFATLVPVAAASLRVFWSERQLFDWVRTVQEIEGEWRDGDVVAFMPGWLAGDYLNNGGKPLPSIAGDDLDALRAAPRVWLVLWEDAPEQTTREALKALRSERGGIRRIEGAGITLSLLEQ